MWSANCNLHYDNVIKFISHVFMIVLSYRTDPLSTHGDNIQLQLFGSSNLCRSWANKMGLNQTRCINRISSSQILDMIVRFLENKISRTWHIFPLKWLGLSSYKWDRDFSALAIVWCRWYESHVHNRLFP